MDWGVGKITFSPGWPQSIIVAPTGQPARAWTTREKEDLLMAMRRIDERENGPFPCGWDERDAKV